ncbi:MAG: hypothetical protein ACYTG0_03995 [Planctomycetota bacterium]
MRDPLLSAFVGLVAAASQAAAAEVEPLLKTISAVGPSSAGSQEATRAWEELVEVDAARLPVILAALDDANPLAANWIRCAVDAIAEREIRGKGKLPAAEIERFVLDTGHAPRARRLAYEWLVRVDPSAADRLIPGMLHDPSVELRRDAVARLIGDAVQVAELSEPARALRLYRRALAAARDFDQIRLLAGRLKELDEPVDLARQLGFLMRWKLIGPFDNTGEKGFDVTYPPEREIDRQASYPGKHGPVRWIDHQAPADPGTVDVKRCGLVDFNKALEEEKAVVGYAAAQFFSERQSHVQLRVTSDNAFKVWLNGVPIGEHNVYHAGSQPDQFVCRGTLEPGENVILVKVCQNEQTQDWARGWGFQLRVCDATGGAVLSADRDVLPSAGRPSPTATTNE